jgi:thioredoxin-dependent peroxiredoxin
MTTLKTGDIAPHFALEDADGKLWRLSDTAGRWRVLYFYPKDNTSGCTTEALDFTSLLADFAGIETLVIGVSADSTSSHRKFIQKHGLEVTLLSDPEHHVLENYGVWAKKKIAGREYMGIVRSTFLIGPDGVIRKIWPRVSVKGHAAAVLQAVSELVSEKQF